MKKTQAKILTKQTLVKNHIRLAEKSLISLGNFYVRIMREVLHWSNVRTILYAKTDHFG